MKITFRACRPGRHEQGRHSMNSSRVAVSAELSMGLVGPEHTIVPVMASLHYTSEDPYAVKMAFHVGTDEPVEWALARDLLAAAPASPGGIRGGADRGHDGLDQVRTRFGVGPAQLPVEVFGRGDADRWHAQPGADRGEVRGRARQVEHPRGPLPRLPGGGAGQ